MITRHLTNTLLKRVEQAPVVALLGSRQAGKTTLARGLNIGKVIPGLIESMKTIEATRGVIVIPDGEAYPLKTVTASGLRRFLESTY